MFRFPNVCTTSVKTLPNRCRTWLLLPTQHLYVAVFWTQQLKCLLKLLSLSLSEALHSIPRTTLLEGGVESVKSCFSSAQDSAEDPTPTPVSARTLWWHLRPEHPCLCLCHRLFFRALCSHSKTHTQSPVFRKDHRTLSVRVLAISNIQYQEWHTKLD